MDARKDISITIMFKYIHKERSGALHGHRLMHEGMHECIHACFAQQQALCHKC